MYREFVLEQPFYQGDILSDFPLLIIPTDFDGSKDKLSVEKSTIIILTQTCTIQREEEEFITIAKVFTIERMKKVKAFNKTQINSLMKQRMKNFFYFPHDDDFPESCVDFNLVVYAPKDLLDKSKRIKSLSDLGRHWLSYKISDFFGRPIDRPNE